MKSSKVYIEMDGKRFEASWWWGNSLRGFVGDHPEVVREVEAGLYVVTTAEDSPDSGIGGFVHMVTRSRRKAVNRLRKVAEGIGFGYVKRGTNDGDEHADERYDASGMRISVNTFGCGVSVDGEVKYIPPSDIGKETCI